MNAIIRGTSPADPSDANTTVIIIHHDVIVVGANITPCSSRAGIAEIRNATKNPVRVINMAPSGCYSSFECGRRRRRS